MTTRSSAPFVAAFCFAVAALINVVRICGI
jgi:hypothetical protein